MTLTACNGRPATVINGRAVNSTNNSGVNGGLSIDNQIDQDSDDSLVSSYGYNGTGTSDGTDTVGSNTDTYSADSNGNNSGTSSIGTNGTGTGMSQNESGTGTGTQQNTGSGSAGTGNTQNTGSGTGAKALVGTKVETDYFTVVVPASWSGKYVYETSKKDDGSFEIRFYEYADRTSAGGGLVFTLALYPDGTNYSFYPNYKTIGKLSSGTTNYTLLAVYPTDIQYTDDNETQYLAMTDGTDSIINSITPADNYELTRGGDGYSASTSGKTDSGFDDTTAYTPYFNLSIPESWSGKYTYSWIDRNDGGYEVKFYEYADSESNGTGFLFSLVMFPNGTDYTLLPNHEKQGTITTANGTYDLVLVYPSDVQYSEENTDLYDSMRSDIPSIVNSISASTASDAKVDVPSASVDDDSEAESLKGANAAGGTTADESSATAITAAGADADTSNNTVTDSTLQTEPTSTDSSSSSNSSSGTTIESITDN